MLVIDSTCNVHMFFFFSLSSLIIFFPPVLYMACFIQVGSQMMMSFLNLWAGSRLLNWRLSVYLILMLFFVFISGPTAERYCQFQCMAYLDDKIRSV